MYRNNIICARAACTGAGTFETFESPVSHLIVGCVFVKQSNNVLYYNAIIARAFVPCCNIVYYISEDKPTTSDTNYCHLYTHNMINILCINNIYYY